MTRGLLDPRPTRLTERERERANSCGTIRRVERVVDGIARETAALAPEDATFEIESKRHLPVSWLRCEVATRWRRGRTPPAPSATTAPEPPLAQACRRRRSRYWRSQAVGGGAIRDGAADSSIGDARDEAHAVVTTGGGTGVARVVAVASPEGDAWTASVLSLLGATAGAARARPSRARRRARTHRAPQRGLARARSSCTVRAGEPGANSWACQ